MELPIECLNLGAMSMEILWRRRDVDGDLSETKKCNVGAHDDVGPTWMPEDGLRITGGCVMWWLACWLRSVVVSQKP